MRISRTLSRLLFLAGILYSHSLNARINTDDQQRALPDSAYIQSYEQELTGRLYFSQKYTSISVNGSDRMSGFRYRPNTTLNFGIGATYRSFSLNLAYGFPGLNGDGSQRGKTRYLDLQSHFYSRKWVMDVFGQFYKGYYISPDNYIPGVTGYYIKPDLKVRLIGFSGYYIFNHNRFSYRAALIQNEWQTKSAGTFLAGIDFYYGILNSRHTIIPDEVSFLFPQGSVQRFRFINFGPGIGYAYTFVYQKNWFATASLTATLTADFSKEKEYTQQSEDHFSLSPNLLYRIGVGYNSRQWACIFSLVNSTVSAVGASSDEPYRIRTGNYRLTLAKRFSLKRKARQILKPVDKILNGDM